MLKNILKLNGVLELGKQVQNTVKGGLLTRSSCATVCITAPAGTRCRSHANCPLLDGECDGNGGFYNL